MTREERLTFGFLGSKAGDCVDVGTTRQTFCMLASFLDPESLVITEPEPSAHGFLPGRSPRQRRHSTAAVS
jgi:hypothetical protein